MRRQFVRFYDRGESYWRAVIARMGLTILEIRLPQSYHTWSGAIVVCIRQED